MKKDPVQYSLALKLKLNMITLPQLQDGITECFILTNRTFLERRMGKSVAISEIDSITRELIAQVFSENNISRSSTSISDIPPITIWNNRNHTSFNYYSLTWFELIIFIRIKVYTSIS